MQYFQLKGRPWIVKDKMIPPLEGLAGEQIKTRGVIEIHVDGIGIVQFVVVDNCNHEVILGWDQLYRYGWSLVQNGQSVDVKWGTVHFKAGQVGKSEICVLGESKFKAIVEKYSDVFGKSDVLPAAKLEPFSMKTHGPPIAQRPYRTALARREIVDKEIDKMLALKVIRPSRSSWASPITLVPKKDGSIRFCIDYRACNAVTERDQSPLPLIQDIFDQLQGAKWFSTLDLRSGYWQMPVAEDTIPKTAFTCHRGLFEWVRMPFGLANAPAAYQRAISKVLSPFIGKFVSVFIDDICIYSKTEKEHAEHLEAVFEKLREHNITVKREKCDFGKHEVELLGYRVSEEGIRAQPKKTEAIYNMPAPANVSNVRTFCGMTSYYRQLIPGYARIAEPLHNLTKKGVPWKWGTREQHAFQSLKDAITSDRVMVHPQIGKPYILYTDASNFCVGAVLCQEDEEGIERPIQYVSAQLSPAQKKWCTIEKEAFAVIFALKRLRAYLLGSQVTLYTDHKPLLSLFTKDLDNTKIQRWAVMIAEYGVRIKYRPGQNNVRADMLSRIPPHPKAEMAVLDATEEWVSLEDVQAAAQPSGPLLADNIDHIELGTDQQAEFPEEWASAGDPESQYLIEEGILYTTARPRHDAGRWPRVLLPSKYRENIIDKSHREGGHMGVVKTMWRIQEHYVWPSMRRTITDRLNTCGLCLVHQTRPQRPPMGEMPIATCPGMYVGIDLVGPMVPSVPHGYQYALICIDHYSGWAEGYPILRKSNECVWEKLRNDYVPRHGSPVAFIMDNGSEFKGKPFEQWLKGNAIKVYRTTPYNPAANGKTERLNRTLKTMIAKLVNGERSQWAEQLPVALQAYRSTVSTVTGYTPFFLHHARPARVPIGKMLDGSQDFTLDNRLENQAQVMQKAAEHTKESRHYNRERLNRKANSKTFNVGDTVLFKAQERLTLTAKWDHGWVVTRVRGKVVHLLHPQTGKTAIANVDKVKHVDPSTAWDEVRPRPRRVQQRRRPEVINPPPRPEPRPQPMDVEPAGDVRPQAPPMVPPLYLKRQRPEGDWAFVEAEHPSKRWRPDQVAVLDFAYAWFCK